MSNSKVFIIQKPYRNLDFSAAETYGDLVYIFDTFDNPSETVKRSRFTIMKMLKEFDSTKDFITFAGGDPIVGLLVGSCLMELNIKNYNYLSWQKDHNNKSTPGFYIPVEVDFNDFWEEDDDENTGS